jgi:hypothetical protein
MNSRKLGILLFAGLMAGGTVALADDGQFEDWKVVGTCSHDTGYVTSIAVAPSDPSRVCASVTVYGDGDLYRSDNGGNDWTYVAPSDWGPMFGLAINPADKNLMFGVIQG